MPSRQFPLRTHMLLFALACLAPLLAGVVFLGQRYVDSEQRALERRIVGLSSRVQERLDRDLDGMIHTLAALATSPEIDHEDFASFRQQAQAVLGEALAIGLRNPDGSGVMNSLAPRGSSTLDRPPIAGGDTRVFERARPVVTNLYIGRLSPDPVIAVDVPVVRDTKVRYGLTMVVPAAVLTKHLRQALPNPDWLAVIVGSDHRVLARTRAEDRFRGQAITPQLESLLSNGPGGSGRSRTLDGEPVFSAYTVSPLTQWTVVFSAPEPVLNRPLTTVLWVTVTSVGLVVLASWLAGLAYSRSLSRDFALLTRNVAAVGRGEIPAPLATRVTEITQIQDALVRDAEQLQSAERHHGLLLAELAHRVKNMLAVIQSLIARTVRDEVSAAQARETLVGRVASLARGHETLSDSNWEGGDLCHLLTLITRSQNLEVTCDGPEVLLTPRSVVALSQTFQELLTNARTHGALHDPHGRITVAWTTAGGDLSISWQETGTVETSSSHAPGFGLTIVRLCVERQLGGRVEVIPHTTGWWVNLQMPLVGDLGPNVVASAPPLPEARRYS